MAGRLTPREREYKTLVEQVQALEEDIQAARNVARRTESEIGLDWHHEVHDPVRGEDVRLPDGASLVVRQVEPTDLHNLQVGFDHLGALSRYRRFRERVDHLSQGQLTAVTQVDHESEEVLIASTRSAETASEWRGTSAIQAIPSRRSSTSPCWTPGNAGAWAQY